MVFVYITTNLLNGKSYIGSHSTNNIEDGYLGSGKYIRRAIKKYGKKNFNRRILSFFDNINEAYQKEELYIDLYETIVPLGYNISPKGGHRVKGGVSDETKDLIRRSQRGRVNMGKIPWNKGKSMIDLYGVEKAEEIKEKIRKGNIGLKQSDETIQKRSLKHIGRKNTNETKIKMSLSSKGRPKKYDVWNKGKILLNITPELIDEVKKLYSKGMTQKKISDMKNLSSSCISRIIRGIYDDKKKNNF